MVPHLSLIDPPPIHQLTHLNSFTIIHQYGFSLPVKLLSVCCTLPLLSLQMLLHCPRTHLFPLWKFLFFKSHFDFGCIFIPEVWCCLVIMNDGHYESFPQQKFKHLKRPHILSLMSLHTDYFTHSTVFCRSTQMLTDLLKKYASERIRTTFSIFHCPTHT